MKNLFVLGLLLLSPVLAAAQDGAATLRHVVPVTASVEGRTQSDYANLWWQWAFSMPQRQSPVRDATGADCAINQEGPVWFLAGGYGSSRISRRCTVPPGQHIFFPIINMLVFTSTDRSRTCDAVRADVAENNDRFVQLRVILDGAEITGLQQQRIASQDCFDPLARVPRSVNPPSYAPAATDGYWVMLRPLPPGDHRLEFRAFYTNQNSAFGDMVQNITYDLTVLP